MNWKTPILLFMVSVVYMPEEMKKSRDTMVKPNSCGAARSLQNSAYRMKICERGRLHGQKRKSCASKFQWP